MGFFSANKCCHCKRQLTISGDKLGYKECADCTYFHNREIYSVEDYNNWLKQ